LRECPRGRPMPGARGSPWCLRGEHLVRPLPRHLPWERALPRVRCGKGLPAARAEGEVRTAPLRASQKRRGSSEGWLVRASAHELRTRPHGKQLLTAGDSALPTSRKHTWCAVRNNVHGTAPATLNLPSCMRELGPRWAGGTAKLSFHSSPLLVFFSLPALRAPTLFGGGSCGNAPEAGPCPVQGAHRGACGASTS